METSVGIHVRTRDRVSVLDAVRSAMEAEGLAWLGGDPEPRADALRLLLMPPRGVWTSLYPEEPRLARSLSPLLAARLKAAVLTVGRVEDAAVFYRYHEAGGELVDEYHSCPDYEKDVDEDDASDDELERTRGRPEALRPLLAAGQQLEALASAARACRIERLRDHSAGATADPQRVLSQLEEALALPDLLEGFEELWHMGQDDDDDVDLRYLAYGEPARETRVARVLGRLRERVITVVRRRRGSGPAREAPAKADEAEADEADDEADEGGADGDA